MAILLHMGKATWLGLLIGFGGILLGNILEGGHTSSLMQLTAGIIVLSGTIGAVLVSHPIELVSSALKLSAQAFKDENKDVADSIVKDIVECTRICKRDSLMAIEPYITKIDDPFLKKIIRTSIDGLDPNLIREIYQTEIETIEEQAMHAAKVWTDAGGFSPTIGIIGAVLGLIHVMGNLTDTSKLGSGIAVAFVATVYGVSLANLLFLPIGNKIKKIIQNKKRIQEMTLEGALLINSGLSSVVVDQKIRAYLAEG